MTSSRMPNTAQARMIKITLTLKTLFARKASTNGKVDRLMLFDDIAAQTTDDVQNDGGDTCLHTF